MIVNTDEELIGYLIKRTDMTIGNLFNKAVRFICLVEHRCHPYFRWRRSMDNDIFHYIHDGDLKDIERLVAKDKAVINARDKIGRTSLMEYAIANNPEFCRFFIEHGADVNLQENGGWTALHFAAQEYSAEIVELLLKNDALVDVKDNFGNTPQR